MLKAISLFLVLLCSFGHNVNAQDSLDYYLEPVYSYVFLSEPPLIPQCGQFWSHIADIEKDNFKIKKKGDRFGLVTDSNKVLIPIIYDTIYRVRGTDGSVFVAKSNNKFGLLSVENDTIWPIEYNIFKSVGHGACCNHMNGLFYVVKDDKCGLLRSDGTIKVDVKYDFVAHDYDTYDCPTFDNLIKVANNDKFGLIDSAGNLLIPLKYDFISYPAYSYIKNTARYITILEGKYGLVDMNDSIMIPHQYNDLHDLDSYHNHLRYAFKKYNKWGVITNNNRQILPPKYDSIQTFYGEPETYLVTENNKWGVVDTSGKIQVPVKYDEIIGNGSRSYAYRLGKRWGFVRYDGLQLTSARYDEIEDTGGDFALVIKYGKYGVCNMRTGKEIAAPIYEAPYHEDYLYWGYEYSSMMCWEKNGEYGVIDSSGNIIIPFIYDEYIYTNHFGSYGNEDSPNYTTAWRNGKKYFLNEKGKVVFGGIYDDFECHKWTSYYYFTENNGKFGLLNRDAKLLVSTKYDGINLLYEFYESEGQTLYFKVEKDGKYGVLDSLGKLIVPVIYDRVELKNDSEISVTEGDKVGLVNSKGVFIEPFSYPRIQEFDGSVGIIKIGAGYFFSNKEYELLDSQKYYGITNLGNGFYDVDTYRNHGICDSTGKILIEPKYDKIKFFDGTFGAVKSNNYYGFINGEGDTICDFQFEKVKDVYKDFVCIRNQSRFGIVNKMGEVIVPTKYTTKIDFGYLETFGYTPVRSRDGYGLIDTNFVEIIPAVSLSPIEVKTYQDKKYVIVDRIVYNSVFVGVDDSRTLYGVYNEKGEEIIPSHFLKISDDCTSSTGLFKVSQGLYGLHDVDGNLIADYKYDYINGNIAGYSDQYDSENLQPYLIYYLNGFYGVISITGEELTKAEYYEFQFDSETKELQLKLEDGSWINIDDVVGGE